MRWKTLTSAGELALSWRARRKAPYNDRVGLGLGVGVLCSSLWWSPSCRSLRFPSTRELSSSSGSMVVARGSKRLESLALAAGSESREPKKMRSIYSAGRWLLQACEVILDVKFVNHAITLIYNHKRNEAILDINYLDTRTIMFGILDVG